MSARRRASAAPSLFAEPEPVAPPVAAPARPVAKAAVIFAPTPRAERVEAVFDQLQHLPVVHVAAVRRRVEAELTALEDRPFQTAMRDLIVTARRRPGSEVKRG